MNILFISQRELTLRAGGAIGSTDLYGMAKALIKKGNKVNIIACSNRKKPNQLEAIPFVKYIVMPGNIFIDGLWFSFMTLIYCMWYLFYFRPETIIVDYLGIFSTIPAAILSRLRIVPTKFVIDIRTIPVDTYKKRALIRYNYSLKLAKALFHGISVITPMIAEDISKRHKISIKTFNIWSSGFETELFIPIPQKDARKKLNWPDVPTFLYHGVLSKYRGLQNLIRAANILKKDNLRFKIVLLGTGEAQSELKILIRDLNIEDHVLILNPVSIIDVPLYIAATDFAVVPLPDQDWWNVSSPLKIIEYLAMQRFIICSNIEAHRLILDGFECFKYFYSLSPEGIASTMKEILFCSEQKVAFRMADRADLNKNYSWDSISSGFLNYLNNISLTSNLRQ